MNKKQLIITYRLGFGLLAIIAAAAELAYGLERSAGFSLVNFFSSFTIESSLFGVVTFLMAAYMLRDGQKDRQLENLRGAATAYLVLAAIVHNARLGSGSTEPVAWAAIVLHVVFPIVVLLDWLYIKSDKPFTDRQALRWLIYPAIYAVYVLFRGPFAHHWYPYPFINVSQYGYGRVFLNCLLLAVGGAVLTVAIARLPGLAAEKLPRIKTAQRRTHKAKT